MCQVGSMLHLVRFRILDLFGLMLDSFWKSSVLWDSMLGALGLRFGSLGTSKWSILRVLGSLRAQFLVTFEGPEAPGHAPGGSLCSKGGLDRFFDRFWELNGRPRELKCLPKSI